MIYLLIFIFFKNFLADLEFVNTDIINDFGGLKIQYEFAPFGFYPYGR